MDMVLRHGIPAHVIQTFDYMTLIVSLSLISCLISAQRKSEVITP